MHKGVSGGTLAAIFELLQLRLLVHFFVEASSCCSATWKQYAVCGRVRAQEQTRC